MSNFPLAAVRSSAHAHPVTRIETGSMAAALAIALIALLALAGLSVDASIYSTAMTGTP